MNDLIQANADDDSFDFFNDLLQESLEIATEAQRVVRARQRLRMGIVDTAAQDRELVATWEVKREWTAVANTAMFAVQQCSCGRAHKHFTGTFQRQEHRNTKVTRWVQAMFDPKLPSELKDTVEAVEVCAVCITKRPEWSTK